MANVLSAAAWIVASCLSAELLGYGLHRLLHSGRIGFLSRNHMKHHLVLYGPLQVQRSKQYRDATDDSVSLGNIGVEWLIPAAALMACALGLFHLFHVWLPYQLIYFGVTLGWSFLMFSWLHDVQHIEGFWMEKNRVLRGWFLGARWRHKLHHCSIGDDGLMNKNFGIGFFLFDRVFGTFSEKATAFNHNGYQAARDRFKSMLGEC
jgi:sterol desaturase/sphingolipid hydroxylase (fatty acid hydroxylase superfamily)